MYLADSNATTAGLFQVTTGFCADVAAGTNDTAIFGCANTILAEADFDLNNLFSTIFGFTCIQSALFLITCCVINWRHEELRFRKIDSKRSIRAFSGLFQGYADVTSLSAPDTAQLKLDRVYPQDSPSLSSLPLLACTHPSFGSWLLLFQPSLISSFDSSSILTSSQISKVARHVYQM